jgi:type III secretion protein V
MPAYWVSSDLRSTLEEHGIRYYSGLQIIIYHLSLALRHHAEEFLGTQESSRLLDQLKPDYTELLKELQGALTLKIITEVLKRLVAENVSVRDIRNISEALLRNTSEENDSSILTEFARMELKRYISHAYSDSDNVIAALLLEPSIEQKIRTSVQNKQTTAQMILDPEETQQLKQDIDDVMANLVEEAVTPVIVVPQDIRRFVRDLIKPYFPTLAVLSYQELTAETTVKPLKRIGKLVAPQSGVGNMAAAS